MTDDTTLESLPVRLPVVARLQPRDEIAYDVVPPHPLGEPLEPLERLLRRGVVRVPLEEAVDPLRVGPVALDAYGGEVVLLDQPCELGFHEIPPYYHNPIPGAHYLKADLETGPRERRRTGRISGFSPLAAPASSLRR